MSNNKDNIEIFYVDLDGTTLDVKENGKLSISVQNLNAIREARTKGKEVIVSTGRLGKQAEKFIKVIDGPYAITGNGSIILDKTGKIIREWKLDVRQVLLLYGIAQKNGLVFKLDDGSNAYGAFNLLQRKMSEKFHLTPVKGYHFEMHKQYYKMVFWGKLSKKKILAIKEEMEQNVPNVCVVTSSHGWTLEVTHENATKGEAARYITQELYQRDIRFTAHVGDTMNDSTAFGKVGKLIVMNNGDKKLKEISPFRGPNYKEGGLARILRGDYWEISK